MNGHVVNSGSFPPTLSYHLRGGYPAPTGRSGLLFRIDSGRPSLACHYTRVRAECIANLDNIVSNHVAIEFEPPNSSINRLYPLFPANARQPQYFQRNCVSAFSSALWSTAWDRHFAPSIDLRHKLPNHIRAIRRVGILQNAGFLT